MRKMGRLLFYGDLLLAFVGAVVWLLGGRLSFLGKLPGDFRFGNVYFPLATSLLVSAVLTILLNLLLRIWR